MAGVRYENTFSRHLKSPNPCRAMKSPTDFELNNEREFFLLRLVFGISIGSTGI